MEWGKDYQRFKKLIDDEDDIKKKEKYRSIVNALQFSGGLLVLSGFLGVIFT